MSILYLNECEKGKNGWLEREMPKRVRLLFESGNDKEADPFTMRHKIHHVNDKEVYQKM